MVLSKRTKNLQSGFAIAIIIKISHHLILDFEFLLITLVGGTMFAIVFNISQSITDRIYKKYRSGYVN